MKKWKLKATTTDYDLIAIGFKKNTMFDRWERTYKHGYLSYTAITKKRTVVQKISTTDFQSYEYDFDSSEFKDLIDKGLVEQIETNEKEEWWEL